MTDTKKGTHTDAAQALRCDIHNHAHHFYWIQFSRKHNAFKREQERKNFGANGTELRQFDTFRRVSANWLCHLAEILKKS